jgi:diguanylate cyclase (GGDEF)-like protein
MALREAQGAAEAYRLSLTDDLTDLPNRRALVARMQAVDRPDSALTLLLLDLDGFKDVNDTLGHIAGDHVLQELSRRLRDRLDDDVLLARLGGDEFAVVLATGDEEVALRAATRIRELVAEPMEVHGHTFLMEVSVGVAVSRHPGTRADLLRRADIAMYQAKTTRAGTLVYDPDRDEFTTERLKTAEYLRLGIPGGQLRVWYQPQVQATSHRLTGVEALVRWEHPELGVLPPASFLAIARQTGMMPLLTETVLERVLNDIRGWHRAGARFPVSFNVAPPELLNPALLERLLEQIEAAGLPPNSLVLEVTEDSLLADPDRARLALLEISRHRIEVAIDDYGTGFSSLSYLRDLPVHELKLDQSFISTVRSDPRSRIIVASTNQMAQGLGLRTVAEGVENALIAETVRELGIDVIQGFFIARPMPADELLAWQAHWQQALIGVRPT